MIILIRHAQSEGNKNREIHQLIPDHRVKLTEDGWVQVNAHLICHRGRPTKQSLTNHPRQKTLAADCDPS
jgi:broad specificity phosphatase PhoE